MRAMLKKKADMTLKELKEDASLDRLLPASHHTSEDMGLTYKK